MEMNDKLDIQDIEIELLLLAIKMRYDYDFLDYSRMHIKRRVKYRLASELNISSISELQYKILYQPEYLDKILQDFSINVTEMFRDPKFYKELRENIFPILRTYPFLKIWHAGCSTGEEVYSMAILLKEEGLYERTQIYATDFNEVALNTAREGIYSIDKIREYTYNYQKSGGIRDFSDYYRANYEYAILDKSLRKNIIFSNHNLVKDSSFGEMNLIICRNVMIYFNSKLQERVINLFLESLIYAGFLGIGLKESLRLEKYKTDKIFFKEINEDLKIYKKIIRD